MKGAIISGMPLLRDMDINSFQTPAALHSLRQSRSYGATTGSLGAAVEQTRHSGAP